MSGSTVITVTGRIVYAFVALAALGAMKDVFILWKSITFLLLIVGGEFVVQLLLLKLENKKKN